MNRYEFDGMLADLRDGKLVLHVVGTEYEVDAIIDQAADALDADVTRIVRSNGLERIEVASGGVLRVRSAHRSFRGVPCEVLLVNREILARLGELVHLVPELVIQGA
jgi:hypothetical protein